MQKILANLIAGTIPSKKLRHQMRQKLTTPSLSSQLTSIRNHINAQIENILEKQNLIESILFKQFDITKAPQAVGVMRKVQMLAFECLKQFDIVCRKHHLTYWLDFGTLLGAIRHNGFIPWDDDIDVGMPIEDYNRFCQIAAEEFKDTCCFFKKVPSQIGKILHKDYMPQTDEEWSKFIFWSLSGRLAFAVDIFPYYTSDKNIEDIKSALTAGCDAKTQAFSQFKTYADFEKVAQVIAPYNKSISSESGNFLFLGLETRVYQPHIYQKEDMFPLKEHDFEGHKMFVPNNYNKILIDTYGDYMTWPRHNHTHLKLKELDATELIKLNKEFD